MSDPTNAELLVHLRYIREAQDQTNSHLSRLNGRVGTVEQKIAVIESQASDAKQAGAKWGGIVGGLIAGALMVWQLFQGK
jgi:hypothetical protein